MGYEMAEAEVNESLSPFNRTPESSLCRSPSSSSDTSSLFNTSAHESFSAHNRYPRTGNSKKNGSFTFRIKDHVRLGSTLRETVKGKVSLGARVVREGGRANIFKNFFGVEESEKLFKASQCYVSTSGGPIAGLVFISSHKIAFCSERPITIPSSSTATQFVTTLYKVVIPIEKIKRADEIENEEKPEQKYIKIVTDDHFEFWFMGFLRYELAFKNLQKALKMANEM